MSFAFAQMSAQQTLGLINERLAKEQVKNKWDKGDVADWRMSDQYTDKSTGITHAYVQQKYNNIDVFNALSVFGIKNNKVFSFKTTLIPNMAEKAKDSKPSITAEAAIGYALADLKKEAVPVTLISTDNELNKYTFEAKSISNHPIKVQLVYCNTVNGLFLCWDVSIDLKGSGHWWNVRVNAMNGHFVEKNDFVQTCSFEAPAASVIAADNKVAKNKTAAMLAPMMPLAPSSYNVFPLPIEAPSFGPRAILNNPSDNISSPYGWHDTDGADGAEFTITRGNNVYVYEDQDADDLPGY